MPACIHDRVRNEAEDHLKVELYSGKQFFQLHGIIVISEADVNYPNNFVSFIFIHAVSKFQ